MNVPSVPRALAAAGLLAMATGLAHAQGQDRNQVPFASCVELLRRDLPQHPEVHADTFDAQVHGAEDLRPVIQAATESQPEFKLAIWDYIARLVDDQRIGDGKAALAAQAAPLQSIAARHGVDPATAVAVYGVETDYGRVAGRYRVVDATLSRACMAPANKERKNHFFAALWLVQQGLVKPDNFRGSWAGAFGLTQFMPGTFVTYMDHGDANAQVDIVGNPADALATTANFIAGSGWTRGLRWGVEVTRPKTMAGDTAAAEREHACLGSASAAKSGKCRSVDQWAALGVKPVANAPALRGDAMAALLAPAGDDGPAWLVTRNYQALWQYNRSDAYALAIGLLSDALRGEPPMWAAWPTDDPGLGRAQMRALQAELVRRGHDDVNADGFDGPRTRDAIRAEERRLGLSETGHPGLRIVKALQ